MAGIYTFTDSTRGVWNAPANTTLSSVDSTIFKINDGQQADLNMPVDGKAVNAIRDFIGRGTVIWGARTLDGNSNDYRYIQVRRTLIYIEQSIKNALNGFVFAPNDGNTWVTVTAMASNFLQDLWSRGGLMGAKASDAFDVQCGLGSTMTPTDILNGYMIVQVRLQMIRPAEFIELTFKQKMQGIS
jgi:phage tail sheath protein FI